MYLNGKPLYAMALLVGEKGSDEGTRPEDWDGEVVQE